MVYLVEQLTALVFFVLLAMDPKAVGGSGIFFVRLESSRHLLQEEEENLPLVAIHMLRSHQNVPSRS